MRINIRREISEEEARFTAKQGDVSRMIQSQDSDDSQDKQEEQQSLDSVFDASEWGPTLDSSDPENILEQQGDIYASMDTSAELYKENPQAEEPGEEQSQIYRSSEGPQQEYLN